MTMSVPAFCLPERMEECRNAFSYRQGAFVALFATPLNVDHMVAQAPLDRSDEQRSLAVAILSNDSFIGKGA